ncbi:hypothetical protein QR680_011635 [Steinernema hermaphroditum]|uniref:Uncharacterized protein n=1 Tax=Steinernema hermaphroditum TaxID=289476 RepID=A0AA39I0E4_9BILA|nr:hypothetical protein QR680_011635 [Steinernema hermaphroditum]
MKHTSTLSREDLEKGFSAVLIIIIVCAVIDSFIISAVAGCIYCYIARKNQQGVVIGCRVGTPSYQLVKPFCVLKWINGRALQEYFGQSGSSAAWRRSRRSQILL